MRPLGYFVHHQGRGHAVRCAALVNALPAARPVTVFSARADIFPPLRTGVEVVEIPSLFERPADAPGPCDLFDESRLPDTLHCAPLGWSTVRAATGRIAAWFASADPALFVVDVSAELAQMARICGVPHVHVLQHGERGDPGHMAAYRGAVGLLAPYDASLAQPDWPGWMTGRAHFAPGLGLSAPMPERAAARRALGYGDEPVVLVLTGGGGAGLAQAPVAVGARSWPEARWVTAGRLQRDWHATEPANLTHLGWVDPIEPHIAAADIVVSATGNTACQQILAAGAAFLAVPEWRYFDEQRCKAAALERAGLAHVAWSPPASVQAWRAALDAARATHDPARQKAAVHTNAAPAAARWLEGLARRIEGAGNADISAPALAAAE